MERILVELGHPHLPKVVPTDEFMAVLNSIISQAVEAKQVRASREKSKKADDRILQTVIAELLERPLGLSRAELLGITEAENLISITARLRNYFRNTIYTFKKLGSGKSTVYFIENQNGVK